MKLYIFLLPIFFISCSPRIAYDASWDKKTYRKANTARFAFYLSKKSKESIRLMNLARMNGPLFAKTYYLDYLVSREVIKSKDDIEGLMKLPYYGSLYADLNRTKDLPRLRPSFSLHLSSAFHALTSGLSGYEGHDRPFRCEVRFKIFGNFAGNWGENCDYGWKQAMDAVMSLMVDEDVSMLGHRKNIFNKKFIRVGCSFKYHRDYGHNYVQDFSNGNLFQRMFKKKKK